MLVTHKQNRAIWITLLDQEHPRGVTMFTGARVSSKARTAIWARSAFHPQRCISKPGTNGSLGLRPSAASSCIVSSI